MLCKAKLLASALAVVVPLSACSQNENVEWPDSDTLARTEHSHVDIDFDKISDAYREATGPEDFEQRVNEIYEGDEVVSIAVEDKDAQTQVVTGFFDKNKNGAIDDGEKVFSITRTPTPETGPQTAQYVTTGYGYYSYYTSPVYPIAWGASVAVGAMAAMAWRGAAYAPYRYATSAARVGALNTYRAGYRAANPARFNNTRTGGVATARSANRSGAAARSTSRPSGGATRPSGGLSRGGGGGRFGLRAGHLARAIRLTE